MVLGPVGVDFATVCDPYNMAALIASVDRTVSEILIPSEFHEAYHLWEDIELQPCSTNAIPILDARNVDNSDPLARMDYVDMDSFSKTLSRKEPREIVKNDDYWVALAMLRYALEQGMARPEPSLSTYKRAGVEKMGATGRYDYIRQTTKFGLCLYGDDGVASLLGAHYEQGMSVWVSHPKSPLLLNDSKLEGCGRKMLRMASTPVGMSPDELLFFATNKDYAEHIALVLRQAEDQRTRGLDSTLIAAKFAATTAIDTFGFMGLPVTSGFLALYEFTARIRKAD